ncbi:MAG: gliding motility protein GldM [Bacteroidota bacterium]|nr:MAG: gliding motility protein GldM [Bacteroidota bacterium]
MGHGKETPRQKMIGMMYLVLMALLALNVSNEVLNAFAVLDSGLTATKSTLEQTNGQVMTNFDEQFMINQSKVAKWYDLAKQVQERSNAIVTFIQEKKIEIIKEADGEDAEAVEGDHINGDLIKGKDMTDVPAFIMIGDNNDKAGAELRKMIEDFRGFLMANVLGEDASEKVINSIMSSLDTEDGVDHKSGEKIPWERAHFEHLPLSGVVVIMSGLQINVRNAESEALRYLYTNIDKGSFKFNNLSATVIPNTNYLIRGNEYNAEIFLAASDTTATPKIFINEGRNPYDSTLNPDGITYDYTMKPGYTEVDVAKSGKGIYKFTGAGLGERAWGGIIEITGPDGNKITRSFKRSVMVAEGSVVVSPTKMNVFYIGVDNPVDVSVAGVMPEKVSINVSNAQADRSSGSSTYIVKPKRPGNCWVEVYADMGQGKKLVGKKEFRVKKVPNPVAKVNDKTGGAITKSVLLAQIGVAAEMENFDFDLKFTVTEFTVSTTIQGFLQEATSNNYKFTKDQKAIINNLSRGQRVYIQDIKAVGPDGSTRDLSTISFILN